MLHENADLFVAESGFRDANLVHRPSAASVEISLLPGLGIEVWRVLIRFPIISHSPLRPALQSCCQLPSNPPSTRIASPSMGSCLSKPQQPVHDQTTAQKAEPASLANTTAPNTESARPAVTTQETTLAAPLATQSTSATQSNNMASTTVTSATGTKSVAIIIYSYVLLLA